MVCIDVGHLNTFKEFITIKQISTQNKKKLWFKYEQNQIQCPIQYKRPICLVTSWYTDVSESHICILTPFPLPTESHMFLGQYNIPPSSSSLTFQKPENKYYWYLPVICMLTTRGTWRRDDNSSRSSIDVLGWTWNERDFSSGLSNLIIYHNRYFFLSKSKQNELSDIYIVLTSPPWLLMVLYVPTNTLSATVWRKTSTPRTSVTISSVS